MRSHVLASAAALLAGLLTPGPAARAQTAAPIGYTQVTRPVVEITDPALIRYLLFELIIEPLQPPSRLQVIDVTLNGYGPDDVVVVFPTMEAFLIPDLVPDSVQKVMSTWAPKAEFRLDAGNLPANALAALITSDADTTRRAENAILYDVVQAVERNYRDLPVGLLFERDSVGFTFQLWDYNRHAMDYQPRPAFVTDSAVNSVVNRLKDIGYVPERGGAEARTAGRLMSVRQALTGIRSIPDGPMRQLAARTVLVGSYDFDRSGAIDNAREIDALPCQVWLALDGTFSGGLAQLGFTDPAAAYAGNIMLNISENVRGPAGRRAAACLAGAPPPPTAPEAVAAATRNVTLPAPVNAALAMEVSREIVERAGARAPGSANWATEVRRVLIGQFDTDSSGSLDRNAEVAGVPCAVWQAVLATHRSVITGLGLDGAGRYQGDRIGIDPGMRAAARNRLEACAAPAGQIVVRRIRPARPLSGARGRPAITSTPTRSLGALRSLHEEEKRLAARTILLAFHDADRSGYLDTAAELDAVSCEVWAVLGEVFPGFAEEYGFVAPAGGARRPFRGSMLFNISESLAEPAARRVTACQQGEVPPVTAAELAAAEREILLPASLAQYLDMGTAVELARLVVREEPGSAGWAAAIQSVLVQEYDFDGSGSLDAAVEVEAVPCIVWSTVRATFGSSLEGLGFGGRGQYLGDRLGVAVGMRDAVAGRAKACGA